MSGDLLILALFMAGLSLIILEAFAPSFGVLGLAGMASFLMAIYLLGEQSHFYGISVSIPVLISVSLIGALILAVSARTTYKTLKAKVSSGAESMKGMAARVIEWEGLQGRVHIDGETWAATAKQAFVIGDTVVVTGRDNLVLHVKKDTKL